MTLEDVRYHWSIFDSEVPSLRPQDIAAPAEPWFWPPPPPSEADGDAEADAEQQPEEDAVPFSPADQLELLTDYLRRTHFYCIWCGCAYDDERDIRENCPGNTRDDH